MADDSGGRRLDTHEDALGQAFYQGDAEALREQMQLRTDEAAARASLAEATGISDEAVLAELAGLGIRVDTLAALTLIPLIHVAWADGVMDDRERAAVLDAAVRVGCPYGSNAYRLLEIWTLEEPPRDLTNAWRGYIQALRGKISSGEAERLRNNVIGRARDVAAAAGDALDRSPYVSPEEEACLGEMENAFGS